MARVTFRVLLVAAALWVAGAAARAADPEFSLPGAEPSADEPTSEGRGSTLAIEVSGAFALGSYGLQSASGSINAGGSKLGSARAKVEYTTAAGEGGWSVAYDRSAMDLDLAGVTPRPLSSTRQTARGLARCSVGWAWLGVGVQAAWRERVESTPVAVLNGERSVGPRIELQRAFARGERLEARLSVGASSPFFLRELGPRTGQSTYAFQLDGEVAAYLRLSDRIQLGVGVRAEQVTRRYEGSGERGLSESTETERTTAFPLTLRWEF